MIVFKKTLSNILKALRVDVESTFKVTKFGHISLRTAVEIRGRVERRTQEKKKNVAEFQPETRTRLT